MRDFGKILVIVILLLSKTTVAQTVAIPDASFRSYLVNNHAGLMNGSQQLILSNAQSYTGAISCSNLGISNLDGIQYFNALTSLDCSHNNLSQFPDLSALTALQTLTCNQNQLTEITGLDNLTALKFLTAGNNLIDTLPDLSNLSALKVLNIANNKIRSIPGLSNLTALTQLYCYSNKIKSLPSLASLNLLSDLVCKNNLLTQLPALTDLSSISYLDCSENPLTSLPSLTGLNNLQTIYAYTCQLTSLPDLSSLVALKILDVNNNKLIAIPNLSSNLNLINVNLGDNKLSSLPSIASLSALTTFRIQNNLLSFEDLEPITAHPSFTSFVIAPQDTLGLESTIEVTEFASASLELYIDNTVSNNVYYWYKENKLVDSTNTNSLSIPYAQKINAGKYHSQIKSNSPLLSGITLYTYPIKLNVKACSSLQKDCYPVLTPDGDGINDVYYVPETAEVKIITKEGKLITEFSAPASWDGRDKNGNLVTMGVYGIVINNKAVTNITVIR